MVWLGSGLRRSRPLPSFRLFRDRCALERVEHIAAQGVDAGDLEALVVRHRISGPISKFGSRWKSGRIGSVLRLGCPRVAGVTCGVLSEHPLQSPSGGPRRAFGLVRLIYLERAWARPGPRQRLPAARLNYELIAAVGPNSPGDLRSQL